MRTESAFGPMNSRFSARSGSLSSMKPVSAEIRPRNRARLSEQPPFELPSQVASLSNGRYTVRLSERRQRLVGMSRHGRHAMVGGRDRDADGFHIYLRDLDDNFVWSAGYQPTRVRLSQYEFAVEAASQKSRGGPRNRMPAHGVRRALTSFEIRRCSIDEYGPCVAQHRADELLGVGALRPGEPTPTIRHSPSCSSRRKYCRSGRRSWPSGGRAAADESETWGFHALVCDQGDDAPAAIQFETNRARFIGRGRTLRSRSCSIRDSAAYRRIGPVLDPIASLRTASFALEPGETQEVAFILGAAQSRSGH